MVNGDAVTKEKAFTMYQEVGDVRVCVCVCVCERKRKGGRGRGREWISFSWG